MQHHCLKRHNKSQTTEYFWGIINNSPYFFSEMIKFFKFNFKENN